MTKTPQLPCLWCRAEHYKPSLEHIVPEALGCPPELQLKDGVCARCNNGLGHVDQALIRTFEVAAFNAGVPRKGGRPEGIDGWGSIFGKRAVEGPLIYFNAGPDDWLVDGRRLKPASAATGVGSHSFHKDGGVAHISYTLRFGEDPKLARAVCKLALGLLAIREGHDAALDPRHDAVRRFVRDDEGDFSFLIFEGEGGDHHSFWPFYRGPNGEGPVIPITLFGIEMAVDLEEGQPSLAILEAQLNQQSDLKWTRLPSPHAPRRSRRPRRRRGRDRGAPGTQAE